MPLMEKGDLNFLSPGSPLGTKSRKGFIPSHSYGLSQALNREEVESIKVDHDQAMRYLRRHPLELSENLENGFCLVDFNGLGLGWAKVVNGRINSHLPKEFRIRKNLSEE